MVLRLAFPPLFLLLLLLRRSIQHGMKRGLYNAVRDIAELSIIGTWSALLSPAAIESWRRRAVGGYLYCLGVVGKVSFACASAGADELS